MSGDLLSELRALLDRHEPKPVDTRSLVERKRDAYRAIICEALILAEGSVTRAARNLKTNRANLYKQIAALGVPAHLRNRADPGNDAWQSLQH